ncbi:hypothetical protein [Phormidium sp. CCY1219]|uniref:hypothetical protein n=1 Tax=Phormidium sp. CCY1219 TaxID=2886104 RepID=UPI002D1EA8CB|nr:hypothetical protein [Phormidium sp. CCY1219]MEB3828706.1 hypothetical protein [Phormidium sp. CCY1219]
MAPQEKRLEGVELIDCAKASVNQGLEAAARQCGYGDDLSSFERELKKAGQKTGIEINDLTDLITPQQQMKQGKGIDIAPDSQGSL